MKFLLVILGLTGLAASEAPYPPSGARPQGPLLVLPSRQSPQQYVPPQQSSASQQYRASQQYVAPQQASASQQYRTSQQYNLPQQQYGAPQRYNAAQASTADFQVVPSISLDHVSQLITERLRQAENVESGNYFVSLPDGRLQNLRYTSAPLRKPSFQNTQQFNLQNAQSFGQGGGFGFPGVGGTSQVNQQAAQSSARLEGYSEGRRGAEEFEEARQGAASTQHAEAVLRKAAKQEAKPQKAEDEPAASQQDPATALPQADQPQQLQAAQLQPAQLQAAQLQPAQLQAAQLQAAQLQEQQQWPAAYVASVQYTEVQPIPAPIYSYVPAPLVRILRHAPNTN